jgi:hypothetical protein
MIFAPPQNIFVRFNLPAKVGLPSWANNFTLE